MHWHLAPRDVKSVWNKAPTIWFPPWAGLAVKQFCRAVAGPLRMETGRGSLRSCALNRVDYERAKPAPGGIRS